MKQSEIVIEAEKRVAVGSTDRLDHADKKYTVFVSSYIRDAKPKIVPMTPIFRFLMKQKYPIGLSFENAEIVRDAMNQTLGENFDTQGFGFLEDAEAKEQCEVV